jgi:hypothetical protein
MLEKMVRLSPGDEDNDDDDLDDNESLPLQRLIAGFHLEGGRNPKDRKSK